MNPEHLCVIEEEEEVEEVEEVEEEDSQENREMDLEYLVDNTTENKNNKTKRCLAMTKMVVCITMVNYLKLLPKHSQIPIAHCSVIYFQPKLISRQFILTNIISKITGNFNFRV